MECDADIAEFCGDNDPHECCRTQECQKSLDALICCFNTKHAPISMVQKWDTKINSTWMDVMKVINEK